MERVPRYSSIQSFLKDKFKMYRSFYKETSLDKEEEIQMYIDLLDDLDETDPKYKKYSDVLKSKFGIEHKKINYQFYIDNPDLNNLKTKKDFSNFKLFVNYCKAIWVKRKIVHFEHLRDYSSIPLENFESLCYKLNIKLIWTNESLTGHGSSDYIKLPKDSGNNLYFVLHELGHVYDYQNNISLDSICKDMRFSPTIYGCTTSAETFAENFYYYFIKPRELKKTFPETFSELNMLINSKWKQTIKEYLL